MSRESNLLFLAALIFLGNIALAFNDGTGDEHNPYQISTPQHLISIGSDENLLDKCFILTEDINLSAYTFTTAVIAPDINILDVQYQGTPFTGTFDGGGNVITNLKIERQSDDDPNNFYLGLFGKLDSEGCIENLSIENLTVEGDFKSYHHVGGLVGINYGNINNCNVEGYLNAYKRVGGLVGSNYGNVSDSYSNIVIESRGDYVGGLIGEDCSDVLENCYSICRIKGRKYVGGLVGLINTCNIYHSYASGLVKGSHYVGGLVGENNEGAVRYSSYSGSVIGGTCTGGLVGHIFEGVIESCSVDGYVRGSFSVGGLIGSGKGEVKYSYSTAHTVGRKEVGGLIGYNLCNLSNCYSNGNIRGIEEVGGLVGCNRTIISNCYSTGLVRGEENVGGIAGVSWSSIDYCFWDIETSGQSTSVGGIGKTTTQMQVMSTFSAVSWDVNNDANIPSIWYQKPGWYPLLRWQNLVEVPDVAGLSLSQAKNEIIQNTFNIGSVSFSQSDIEQGCIISQSVDSNISIQKGFPISLVVSMGKEYFKGNGATDNPYQISTAGQLMSISTNQNFFDKHFVMTNDIDMEQYDYSSSVIAQFYKVAPEYKRDQYYFTGLFDGDNYKIKNLTVDLMNDSDPYNDFVDHVGLFGVIGRDGIVKNLTVDNITIKGEYNQYSGTIAGCSLGTIMNCMATGSVKGSFYTGGLVGNNYMTGVIENCHFVGAVQGVGVYDSTGGLAGNSFNSTINGSSAKGQVSGNYFVGGLVGMNYGVITNSNSDCHVIGKHSVGGLVGANHWHVTNCFSSGFVEGFDGYILYYDDEDPYEALNCAGGLAGRHLGGEIAGCLSTVEVAGTYIVGGLIGTAYPFIYYNSDPVIKNCYSKGDVDCSNASIAGGLIGSVSSSCKVNYCYSTGNLIYADGFFIGGLVGSARLSYGDSFWDIETSGQPTSKGGTGKNTDQMQNMSTFTNAGWDFENIWWINEGRDYPKLFYQPLGDLNNDSHVNIVDLAVMSESWLLNNTDPGYISRCELSGDDTVNILDLAVLIDMWSKGPVFEDIN